MSQQETNEADVFLTIKQVALLLGVSTSTVRRWLKNEVLPYYRFEGSIRIQRKDAIAFIDRSKRMDKNSKRWEPTTELLVDSNR